MASAYGWRKKWILEEVYFDELFEYLDKIRVRKFSDYIMQLAIAQNPMIEDNDERRALYDKLSSLVEGEEYNESEPEFDLTGMEILKNVMSENPRLIVK